MKRLEVGWTSNVVATFLIDIYLGKKSSRELE
jgi:hypothetical protein